MGYIEYENLDLKSMTIEEIVTLEKKFITEELHRPLYDIDERDARKHGYKILARKYWPEYFDESIIISGGISKILKGYCIHHIDFDHSNNIVSNLIVLPRKEHINLHHMFDPSYVGKGQGERNGMYGKKGELYPEGCKHRPPRTKEWREQHSKDVKGKKYKRRITDPNYKFGNNNKGMFKGMTWKVINGKRVWIDKENGEAI